MVEQQRKIAFICYETSFFISHFLPVVRAAQTSGFQVLAFLPYPPENTGLLPGDVEIECINAGRSGSPILRLVPDVISVSLVLRKHRPHVVQAFALHACIVLALASFLESVPRRIFAITGLGLIDIDPHWKNRIVRSFVYWLLRRTAAQSSARFVFENNIDPTRLGLRSSDLGRSVILMGAGVDPNFYVPHPFPSLPPLKLAMVSRMIWSKGIDLGVEAVARLVARGVPVELDLYGAPDVHNRRYFSEATLKEWGRRPGIRWHGFVKDIPAVWRDHHAGLFPSRGGEGLPRAMIEAASCGRPSITAHVAGCADFVRPGLTEGLVVPPNSVSELERAIEALVRDRPLVTSMGLAARERVLATATEDLIVARYQELFAELCGRHLQNSRPDPALP